VDVRWEKYRWSQVRKHTDGKKLIHDFAMCSFWGKIDDRIGTLQRISTEEERGELILKAENAVAHVFDLLGSGEKELGREINWHQDLASGHQWKSELHYTQCKWWQLPKGVDIKGPWELSRCMHFSALGLADWLTGDEKYYSSFKDDIQSWIKENAFEEGVNWSCPMDVALRAINWINAIQLFSHRIEDDTDQIFYDQLVESLWLHGRHIYRNLEWAGPVSRRAGNHFVANLLGLQVLGQLFSFHRVGKTWWDFAKKHLEDQMMRQVNPDGTNFETSTSYHRLVLEMFLWADSLAERVGDPFSKSYNERLSRMITFVATYSGPDGQSPQFGDNDSGRVIWTGLGDNSDHRYLTRADSSFGSGIHRFLLRGTLAWPNCREPLSGSFADGGFYFLRSGPAFLGVRAGPMSLTGAHSHCDQLSFVLSVGNGAIFVDRGTGSYTANQEVRNVLRSTRYHNTPQVNGWEQNSFSLEQMGVFRMRDDTSTQIIEFKDTQEEGLLVAEHSGFQDQRQDLLCQRAFRLTQGSLVIEDSFSQLVAGDLLEWNFHLAPNLQVVMSQRGCQIKSGHGEVLMIWPKGMNAVLETCQHSSEYGYLVPAQYLALSASVEDVEDNTYGFEITY
jgi:uncharacterized heparinase superfamily protein